MSGREIMLVSGGSALDETLVMSETQTAEEAEEDVLLVEEEIIIEDFNIDGICGVY